MVGRLLLDGKTFERLMRQPDLSWGSALLGAFGRLRRETVIMKVTRLDRDILEI